jgi:RHS repeat-associated protein
LKPVSATLLTLERGTGNREIHERANLTAAHYRLRRIEFKNGIAVTLRYQHRIGDREVLSDLIVSSGKTVLTHLATQIDEGGRICEIWQIKDGQPLRQLSRYFYQYHEDGSADLIAAQDENGQTWTYQYRHHLITRYTDRTGRGMNLEWDGEGFDARAYHEWADDGSFDTRLEWDRNIRLTYVIDAEKGERWHFYDILGYTYRIVHPDKNEEWFLRDARKNVTRHLHPDGTSDDYDWDGRDNLVSHTRADGGTTYFEYDDKDNLTGIQDPEGGIWKRDYDGKGNLTEETDPLGNKTEYQYNKFNLPIEITDAKGGKKQITYTESGQIQSYTDCSSKTTQWKYDERCRLKSESNAAGETTQYRYAGVAETNPEALDAEAEQKRIQWARQNAGQLEAVIHPDQSRETFLHDAEGRLLTHADPLNRITEWRYTAAGLIGTRRDALGHLIQYHWDRLGRLTRLTNENSATAKFKYDPVGKLLEETGFDQKTTQYQYDRGSGVLASLKEGDAETRFEFDAAGRLSQRQSGIVTPDGKWNPEGKEEYQWDRNGRLALAKNKAIQLQWFYDPAGNLTTEHQHYRNAGQTAVWHHQYAPLGNRIATLRPDDHKIERLTYGAGYVHGILLDGEEIVGFERDDLHREVGRTLKNGLIHSQGYDPAGRLKEQVLIKGKQAGNAGTLGSTAPQLFKRAYAYDRAGQLTQIKDNGKGERNYRYDPVGRLTEALSPVGKEKFAFDPASNLLDTKHPDIPGDGRSLALETERTPKVSKLLDNLLKDYAGTHYRYDERGNLVEKLKHGEQTRYQWNASNQLVLVQTSTILTRFAYDPLGRRIFKHSEPRIMRQLAAGSQYHRVERERLSREQNLGITFYGWDGDTLAWETTPEKSVHYFYEPDSFVPLAQGVQNHPIYLHKTPDWSNREYSLKDDPLWNQAEEPKPFDRLGFYHCDHLGTPQEITDEQGNIAWSAQYKAWGEAKEIIGNAANQAGFRNPIRFQGQYFDHETGLHYNRHRYYDPETGRFVSKDPIGFRGGLNLHRYVPNPIHWIDPLGWSVCGLSPEDKQKLHEQYKDATENMTKPHDHHIVREKAPENWREENQKLVTDTHALIDRHGIDINTGRKNFTVAENGNGAHTIKAAQHVHDTLKAAEKSGGKAGVESALPRLGTVK